jgi:DNA-binding Lrp family transcriptional regulator
VPRTRGFLHNQWVATPSSPKKPRPALDRTDLQILAELEENGRLTNAALAARVGVAESTCIQRVRALRDAGVITRFRADIDPASLGLGIQAVIKVRLGSHNRDHVMSFHATLADIPGALTIFHVAGEDDYLVHVAVESAAALRDLVLEHITVHPAVRHTETQLVFEVLPGAGVLPRPT